MLNPVQNNISIASYGIESKIYYHNFKFINWKSTTEKQIVANYVNRK